MKKIELLAPAGSLECMMAAVNAGCDAVYMGGAMFGARAFAENADNEALLRAIDWIHVRGKKLYLTVNTLLKPFELEQQLDEFLRPLYLHGLDAVIVQDVGVIRYLSEQMPELPLHLSTQMTLNTAEAAEELCQLAGKHHITRFVPSRELSLAELCEMRKKTKLEIETFIHGALCYSYSGQCLMSSLIGGRSGNRGRCAQPCRLPYQYQSGDRIKTVGEKYLLSPKDICTLELLPELMESGIDSFKIEGRMKRAEYVAGVTEGYRTLMELFYDKGAAGYREELEQNHALLEQINARFMDLYNRGGFSHGFYDCGGGPSMMASERPNHNGVYVGTVKQIRGINAAILLEEAVSRQDILEIRTDGKAAYEFTVGVAAMGSVTPGVKAVAESEATSGAGSTDIGGAGAKGTGSIATTDIPGQRLGKGELLCTNFKPGTNVTVGSKVYRTKNQALLQELERNYLQKNRAVPITGEFELFAGKPMQLTVQQGDCRYTAVGECAQPAQKQPMTEERLREKLNKTSESAFYFETLNIHTDNESFCPVGQLNELRRRALTELEHALAERYRRNEDGETALQKTGSGKEEVGYHANETNHAINANHTAETKMDAPYLQVLVSTEEQLQAVCAESAPDDVYIDITDLSCESLPEYVKAVQKAGKRAFLAFPRILRYKGLEFLRRNKESLMAAEPDGYLVRNLEALSFLKAELAPENGKTPIIMTDSNLYTMNRYAQEFWSKKADFLTAPLELTGDEWRLLDCDRLILPAYGRAVMMVTAQCPNRVAGSCLKQMPQEKQNKITLIDRMNKQMPVLAHCNYCYATIHNSDVYSLAGCADELLAMRPYALRLDFTTESSKETSQVIQTFYDDIKFHIMPDKKFLFLQTKGNYQRGVL